MKKNYNYTRRKLLLPEYGRHIQEMVDSLQLIEDHTERTRQAKAVIAVIGNLNPLLRDTADFTHKLWDHLFIMSDFQLDVDSPYPLPTRQDVMVTPRTLPYPQSHIPFKHYGKYVGRMLRSLGEHSSSEATKREAANIALYMRTKSTEYNNEHPNNSVILKDIQLLSEGNVTVDETVLTSQPSNNTSRTHSPNKNFKRPMQKKNNGAKQHQRPGQNNRQKSFVHRQK